MPSKFWYVAANEYKQHVLKKRFILALLSVPMILAVSFGAGYASYLVERNLDPIGYVDQAGVLAKALPVPENLQPDDAVEIISYETEAQANSALEAGNIQGYYLIGPDYEDNQAVTLIYDNKVGENATDYFYTFFQVNVSAGLPDAVVERALDGFTVIRRDPSSSREFSPDEILNIVLPIVIGFIFTFVLTSGSGYFANAVSEEKENRTIEVLATSMSANEFILGKVLGIVGVIFTQVAVWGMVLALALIGANTLLELEWLNLANLDLSMLPLLLIWFVLCFFFFAGLTLTISSIVTETQESQQMIGIVSMPVGFSYWFIALIMNSPNSPLSVALSLIPFTAPTIMPLRLAFTTVPTAQYLLGLAILTISASFTIWLAARAYELGMLRFGKRLRLAELLKPQRNGSRKS